MDAPSRDPPRIPLEISHPILQEIPAEIFPEFVLCTLSDVFTIILLEAHFPVFVEIHLCSFPEALSGILPEQLSQVSLGILPETHR